MSNGVIFYMLAAGQIRWLSGYNTARAQRVRCKIRLNMQVEVRGVCLKQV